MCHSAEWLYTSWWKYSIFPFIIFLFHDNISYWRPAIVLLKSHFLFSAETKWPLSYFHHFVFHTACLVCGLSVLITYGIHFIANLEAWSIGLLAVLVSFFIITILLIQRQPQNQHKVAFMVNNLFFCVTVRWEVWIDSNKWERGRRRRRWTFSRQSFITVLPLLQVFWWRQNLTAESSAYAVQYRSSQD